MNNIDKLGALFGIFLLAACIPGTKPADTYTDKAGNTTVIESDHEMCIRSCNEAYSRCMETQPAQNSTGIIGSPTTIGPSGMFGASEDCRNDLQSCLPACNAS